MQSHQFTRSVKDVLSRGEDKKFFIPLLSLFVLLSREKLRKATKINTLTQNSAEMLLPLQYCHPVGLVVLGGNCLLLQGSPETLKMGSLTQNPEHEQDGCMFHVTAELI